MNGLNKNALIDVSSGTAVTYQMLFNAAEGLATMFAGLGVRKGGVVMVHCRERLHQALYVLAGLHLPYVINPVNPEYTTEQLRRVIVHAEPALIITDMRELLPTTNINVISADAERHCSGKVSPQVRRYEVNGSLLIYTSGTTGNPKGVLLSPGNITKNTTEAILAFGYNPQSVSASLLPMFHTFTLISDLIPVLREGGTCIVCPTFSAAVCAGIQQELIRYRVHTFSAVPVIFQAITSLFDTSQTSSLRFVISGGAPLGENVRLAYSVRFGHPIIPCYGLGEVTCFATISPLDGIRARSAGKPAGVTICIVGADNGNDYLPVGETGEIVIKGASVISNGYFRDERTCYNIHGDFLTGDIGHLDKDGYLFITGRKKNMIIRGGTKIYLEDVDRCMEGSSGVRHCVSISLVKSGEQDKSLCFIVLKDEAQLSREEVRARVQSVLSSLHIPDEIYFVDTIPMTKTGKPLIDQLLQLRENEVAHKR
ncbi:class I adenylate-forming enzyme family protein [Chitinophaga flava]|uniref:Long-chain fatty acid--CoA ligase n=1 Tax=Chitinophaga flava TaxID=2259036 RepID=A0A365Y0J6_9BACT|nr:class I adenylate-forming enzyme family protein [Chitinophaga flava]RBL92030.1 hypothetical protein DF182_05380 [Chitinophaga flava]